MFSTLQPVEEVMRQGGELGKPLLQPKTILMVSPAKGQRIKLAWNASETKKEIKTFQQALQ